MFPCYTISANSATLHGFYLHVEEGRRYRSPNLFRRPSPFFLTCAPHFAARHATPRAATLTHA